jgi:penicillin amidase
LANRETDHGGDSSTINVGDWGRFTSDMQQDVGSSYRNIVDFSDIEKKSLFLNPLGQSGNEFSKHYDDLLEAWAVGEYLSMTTQPDDIVANLQLNP